MQLVWQMYKGINYEPKLLILKLTPNGTTELQ